MGMIHRPFGIDERDLLEELASRRAGHVATLQALQEKVKALRSQNADLRRKVAEAAQAVSGLEAEKREAADPSVTGLNEQWLRAVAERHGQDTEQEAQEVARLKSDLQRQRDLRHQVTAGVMALLDPFLQVRPNAAGPQKGGAA